jgi:hypothetical protein
MYGEDGDDKYSIEITPNKLFLAEDIMEDSQTYKNVMSMNASDNIELTQYGCIKRDFIYRVRIERQG